MKDIVGDSDITLSTDAVVLVSEIHNNTLIIWRYHTRFSGSWGAWHRTRHGTSCPPEGHGIPRFVARGKATAVGSPDETR